MAEPNKTTDLTRTWGPTGYLNYWQTFWCVLFFVFCRSIDKDASLTGLETRYYVVTDTGESQCPWGEWAMRWMETPVPGFTGGTCRLSSALISSVRVKILKRTDLGKKSWLEDSAEKKSSQSVLQTARLFPWQIKGAQREKRIPTYKAKSSQCWHLTHSPSWTLRVLRDFGVSQLGGVC